MKIDSGGVTLDVEVAGEGRPVVLVHGWPDTKRLWSKQVPALVRAGFQVITYDQRGYGASDKPAAVEAYSVPFLALDATNVLDHLGVERAHLVGHDWGAAVAWAVASLAPTRVDHVVALSVGHPSSFSRASYGQREKSWYMLLFQLTPEGEDWVTEEHLREWAHHPDAAAVHAELVRDGSITPGLNYYRANVPPAALFGPPVQLPSIQSPAMGIWSTADFALLEEQMTGSGEYCAGGWRYERIDGAGHWFQWEQPERVNELLIDFLPA